MFCGMGFSQEHKELPPATEAELKLVRVWLKENTDTGEWKEVKSWGGQINGKGSRYARLKYREIKQGSLVLMDEVFAISKTKVTALDHRHPFYEYRVMFFEETERNGKTDVHNTAIDLMQKFKPKSLK